jgi:hypothetical protein
MQGTPLSNIAIVDDPPQNFPPMEPGIVQGMPVSQIDSSTYSNPYTTYSNEIPQFNLDQDVIERPNPTFDILNFKIDIDSLIVMGICLVSWIGIWRYTPLWQLLSRGRWYYKAVFGGFILYTLANVVTSGNKSGTVQYELNILLTVEQMISIMFGTVVVFLLFGDRLNLPSDAQQVVSLVSCIMLVVLGFASMWINVVTTGRAFRSVRKGKQAAYNIAYALFVVLGLVAIDLKLISMAGTQ